MECIGKQMIKYQGADFMAILFDRQKKKYIELVLCVINDPEWLSYKLSGGEIFPDKRIELFRLDNEDLFLHDSYEKEVEIIIENLRGIKKVHPYAFQPKDEGEFLLKVDYQDGFVLVKLVFRVIDEIDETKVCNNIFEIETSDVFLEDFLYDLEKEYNSITNSL